MPSQGPLTAGSNAGTNWTGTGNTTASDNVYAKYTTSGSDWLRLTNFGFSIPTGATILGLEIPNLEVAFDTGLLPTDPGYVDVAFTKDGSSAASGITSNIPGTGLTITDTNYPQGGAADLWGTTWTRAEINSANFGVLIRRGLGSIESPTTARRIDYVTVRVTYQLNGRIRVTHAIPGAVVGGVCVSGGR